MGKLLWHIVVRPTGENVYELQVTKTSEKLYYSGGNQKFRKAEEDMITEYFMRHGYHVFTLDETKVSAYVDELRDKVIEDLRKQRDTYDELIANVEARKANG